MSLMKSAVVPGLAVGTAVLGLGALATAPAAAAPGCSSGYVCVYNASGSGHAYFGGDPDFADDLYGDGSVVDNNVVSVTNSSTAGNEAHFYRHAGHDGFLFCVNPGSQILGTAPAGASSLLPRRTSIPCY